MLKKSLFLILFSALVTLAACGTEPLDQSEVLKRSVEAVKELDSYSVEMDMALSMMGMDTNMIVTGDVTHNPDAMYLNMKMGMTGMSMDFEAYAIDDIVYMSMFGEWIKVDASEMGLDDFDQLNEEEMRKLLEFSEEFTMEEQDDVYVLTISGEGDEYSVLIENYISSGMADFNEDPAVDDMLETIQVNDFFLELHIDKTTFMQTKQTFEADMVIEESGITMPVTMSGTALISNVNEIEPIAIPDEVKENAVTEDEALFDLELDDELFGAYEELTVEEIQKRAPFTVPTVEQFPEGYVLTESLFDESMEMVMMSYEKDFDNGFMFSVLPTENEPSFNEAMFEGEDINVNGQPGTLYDMGLFISLSWEQDGLLFELAGSGEDLTKEAFLEIAESIK
ncbi:hypothetical protein JCM9140_1163 [Halalkalibacter wakoensis JCM 9140]|uniref:DUF4367 domain-containing protein n=1 Tax=Halalkalibacter wakoensis JCM 9140 TaxID=1236970 RepID=W4Q1D5_9BACI|nr:DUF4367 domain-containing protein [Halalkalibacter wakoensis]GAE25184.1 hypothetical protein JCM9140_1163 [Halalkalibacter wakoensis JCM 9140]